MAQIDTTGVTQVGMGDTKVMARDSRRCIFFDSVGMIPVTQVDMTPVTRVYAYGRSDSDTQQYVL